MFRHFQEKCNGIRHISKAGCGQRRSPLLPWEPSAIPTQTSRMNRSYRPHPYPKSALLNIRGRFASLLSLLIGNRGSSRYVGPRRFRWVWACLAHCPLYHTNTCNTRNPSAKTCAPGCPSPARAQNPASMAARMLACSTVSLALEAYFAVSFFLRPTPPTRPGCRTVQRVNPGAPCPGVSGATPGRR